MRRRLETFDAAAHIPCVFFVQQIVHPGVNRATGIKNRLRFGFTIRLPHVFHVQYCEHYSLCIPQRDLAAPWLQGFSERFGDIERDRYRPENAARELHIVADYEGVCHNMKLTSGVLWPIP